ncbi:MAG: 30S ribosomal protein S6 [Candidatus Babeliaceae bacterium]|nr:30S ribosomal protein S6 [Candidatus Babeliaceae bacterium]
MTSTPKARYEVLFLTGPELTQDEASMIESQLHSLITGFKGEMLSFERWGKYRLSYEVNGSEYGIYFLARFDLPTTNLQEVLNELRTFFSVKHNDLVSRYIIDKLSLTAPLTYRRPESLEDTPQRERTEVASEEVVATEDVAGKDEIVTIDEAVEEVAVEG